MSPRDDASRDIDIRIGDWVALGDDAARVRQAVFVIEQGIPAALEWDGQDGVSIHAVAYRDGRAVGTARLLPDAHIGRMAVLAEARRDGVGGRILQRLLQIAAGRGDRAVELSAQSYVCPFYARHGFEPVGDEYLEVGIAHRRMVRRLA